VTISKFDLGARFPIKKGNQPTRNVWTLPTLTRDEVETHGIPVWVRTFPNTEWVSYGLWRRRELPDDLQWFADSWMRWWNKQSDRISSSPTP